jgi:hypothetical protein
MIRLAGFPRKSSKTPQILGIIEEASHPHPSKTRGLSSERYSPKKAGRTPEEILPRGGSDSSGEKTNELGPRPGSTAFFLLETRFRGLDSRSRIRE